MSDNLPMTVPAPISPAQASQIVNLVRRTARAEILPRFRTLSHAEVGTKSGPEDLVTEADRAAEAMIARGLRQMFPEALIVGEEEAAGDPEIVAKIDDAQLAFAIDPVDGTANFVFGLSTFGVILSATRLGVPVFGLLYDPVMDDWIMAEEHGDALYFRAQRPPRRLVLPDLADKRWTRSWATCPFTSCRRTNRPRSRRALPRFAGSTACAVRATSSGRWRWGMWISCCPRGLRPGTMRRACSSPSAPGAMRHRSTAEATLPGGATGSFWRRATARPGPRWPSGSRSFWPNSAYSAA